VNKVVVRRKDGGIEKGSTGDFRPNCEKFHLHREDGEVSALSIEELKAVFFVKDLAGQPTHEIRYEDNVPGGGKKVQVTFEDGEVIVGFATVYAADRPGWFLVPADNDCNNLRVFVVNSAVGDVAFLS
jgi:hypothetical protein